MRILPEHFQKPLEEEDKLINKSIDDMLFITLKLVFLLLTICLSQVYSQTAKETYENGQRKYKGRYQYCVTPDTRVPGLYHHENRQFGKWIYYYPNGKIKEIRHFTKKPKHCNDKILKHGEWKYFNSDGIHYLTKIYKNDELFYSEFAIYNKTSYIGKHVKGTSAKDTLIIYYKRELLKNVIRNADFEEYYFKPIAIENDGKDLIQKLIPYWYSPDSASPDYYNIHRRISGIPDHIYSKEEAGYNGYVGLLLFRGSERNVKDRSHNPIVKYPVSDFTESIQSKLKNKLSKDKIYCFRMNIMLSPHSGYSINKIGVLFSTEPTYYNYLEIPKKYSLLFSEPLHNSTNWKTLCKSFVATGSEAYITLGRFSSLEETEIIRREPLQPSLLDVNISAYYLIDDLQLYEVVSHESCGCSVEKITESLIPFDELENDRGVKKFNLSSVQFDFDKSEIKESFLPELNKLLTFLINHPNVKIRINGHTDNEGTDTYNYKLSDDRARAIFLWLINNGVNQSRLTYRGFGSEEPMNDISKDINRRVEFEIIEN